jgi:H+/Cl- antiporter ClcA
LSLDVGAVDFMNFAVLFSAPLAGVCSALPVIRCCFRVLVLVLPVLSCRVLYGLLGNSACTPGFYFPSIVDRRK